MVSGQPKPEPDIPKKPAQRPLYVVLTVVALVLGGCGLLVLQVLTMGRFLSTW